jgi:hypothetical protein
MGFFSRLFCPYTHTSTQDQAVQRIRGDGRFAVDVVGEGRHRKTFQHLFARRRSEDEEGGVVVDAELVSDNGNSRDPMTIAVQIGGQRVGFLSRNTARDFCNATKRDGIARWTAYLVTARVYMGGEDERWSVSLDIQDSEFGTYTSSGAAIAPQH